MSKEVLQAIKAICDEKHIPVESVLATIEQALAAAYRKDFGNRLQNLKVDFNPETMGMRVFDVKIVVEDQELDEEGRQIGGKGEEKLRVTNSELREGEKDKDDDNKGLTESESVEKESDKKKDTQEPAGAGVV